MRVHVHIQSYDHTHTCVHLTPHLLLMWVLVLVLAHVTKLDLLTQLNPLLLLLLLLLLLYMLRSLRLHAHLLTHCIFLPPLLPLRPHQRGLTQFQHSRCRHLRWWLRLRLLHGGCE